MRRNGCCPLRSYRPVPVSLCRSRPLKQTAITRCRWVMTMSKRRAEQSPRLDTPKKPRPLPKKFVREMRLANDAKAELNLGDSVTVSVFAETKFVDVIGTSKGKGFTGPMKRWHFGGMPGSHGTERKHRSPGSQAGYGTDRGHGGDIKKGKKMGGHLGAARITVKTHRLVSIDQENNLLVIKGSVPGPAGGYVIVRSSQKNKV